MEYDVIVVGGGVTGAGVARDCVLRGLSVLLLEHGDLCRGATGRNHGLLHSGARYAVTDPASAVECVRENAVLRRIAAHCIDPCDGLFINLPGDDEQYRSTLLQACRDVGIDAREIDGAEALRLEPKLNPAVTAALVVHDASIDPFALTLANVLDATRHGATVLTDHRADRLLTSAGHVNGVIATNLKTGEHHELHASVVVNAAGIWGQQLLDSIGITLTMYPAQGTMLVYATRPCKHVINRCRRPSDADLLVPDHRVSIMGTTSVRVDAEDIDAPLPTPAEVRTIMDGAAVLVPSLAETRVLRAYAGVRPLVATDDDTAGRRLSRGIVCINHGERDGVKGLVTVTGGKLATYRLMAEMATDAVCRELGITKRCLTARQPLPGSDRTRGNDPLRVPGATERAAMTRHGALVNEMSLRGPQANALVCECMTVTRAEVEFAVKTLGAHNLASLRQCTRLGMGPCQGKICACRAANLLVELGVMTPEQAIADLKNFFHERRRGQQRVAFGQSMREAALVHGMFVGLCGINRLNHEQDDD